jgi:hypothetical protein
VSQIKHNFDTFFCRDIFGIHLWYNKSIQNMTSQILHDYGTTIMPLKIRRHKNSLEVPIWCHFDTSVFPGWGKKRMDWGLGIEGNRALNWGWLGLWWGLNRGYLAGLTDGFANRGFWLSIIDTWCDVLIRNFIIFFHPNSGMKSRHVQSQGSRTHRFPSIPRTSSIIINWG